MRSPRRPSMTLQGAGTILLLALLLPACRRAPPPAPSLPSVEPCSFQGSGPVEFVVIPGGAWWGACEPEDLHHCACLDGYANIADRAPLQPLDDAQIDLLLRTADADLDRVADPTTPHKALADEAATADALRGAAGLCPLLGDRPLRVEKVGARGFVLDDPLVGRFEARLLMPRGARPHPGLVALHGHGEDPDSFIEEHGIQAIVDAGRAVLVLGSRGLCVDAAEHRVTEGLLRAGTSMSAVRAYEAWLGLRVMQAHPAVDGDDVALIGHSSGAIAANLAWRVIPGFSALVTDHAGDHYAYTSPPAMAASMAPRLTPWRAVLADPPGRSLRLDYGLDCSTLAPWLAGEAGASPLIGSSPPH